MPETIRFIDGIEARILQYLRIYSTLVANDAETGLEKFFSILLYFDVNCLFLRIANHGTPLLTTIVQKDAMKCLALLLKRDPQLDVNDFDGAGATALHCAAKERKTECLELLLGASSVKVNLRDLSGQTAEDLCDDAHKMLFQKFQKEGNAPSL